MKKWNKFFYRNPKGAVDPDSAWKQQNEQMEKNKVYSMVDFSGGGSFIDVYDENPNDSKDVRKKRLQDYFDEFIVPDYLCEESKNITEIEYQKWHNLQTREAKVHMDKKELKSMRTYDNTAYFHEVETVDGRLDTLSTLSDCTLATVIMPFEEHTLKWRLDRRGAIGETPIHLLFLNGTPKHIEIAEAILERYPELAGDIYEGFEYYGECCMHFAVINNDLEAVKLLLKTGHAGLHARARGKFFVPVDVKRGDTKLRRRKFEGYAYYGAYPLSFAASLGNHTIYDVLIDAGCDPLRSDLHGNTVLHLTVIHNQPDMYYYAVKHIKSKANPNQVNEQNLTPLALAAKLGKVDMFKKILDISSQHYWSYNTITCSAYPLKSLDTIAPDGETDWDSALMMIVRGKKDGHLDMVTDGVVHQLLTEKWNHFGQAKFIRLLCWYILHLIALTIAIYLRPNVQSELRYGTSATDIARYVFECLVVLISLFAVYYVLREIYLESLYNFWQNIILIPSRLFYQCSVFLFVLCVPMRFAEVYAAEAWLLVFAVPGTWSYALFFLRNFSLTGPFITMIFKIFASDIVRFAVIYAIILGTSGVAFFYQFEGQEIDAFLTELGTFMTLFQMSFGEFSYTDVMSGKYQALSILLFVIFMLLAHILLLNMLIAMMTRTFEHITKKAEKIWRRQWASMVVVMERSHKKSEKIRFQRSYDINLNAKRVTIEGETRFSDESGVSTVMDDRALMVVHHQKTSQSERRLNIKNTWKRISKQAKVQPKETPQPTLQIKGFGGMVDFINDAPNEEEEEEPDASFIGRLKSVVLRTASGLSYRSDDEYDA